MSVANLSRRPTPTSTNACQPSPVLRFRRMPTIRPAPHRAWSTDEPALAYTHHVTTLSTIDAAATDLTEALAGQVRRAADARTPLRIVGGETKAFYGRRLEGEALRLAGHAGIVAYDPSELVVTARAGTPLAAIEARLAQHGQRFAFEPPRFGEASTLGGVVASGLSGPRRPFAGAVRDCVLGVTLLDGRGQVLRFGGQVFKNVAGFDLFRLQAGALGALGVILEVSIRVTPAPRREAAVALEMASDAARVRLTELMRRPTPLSGAFHDGARLHLRLSGGEAGVTAALGEIGGEAEALSWWDAVRDHRHPALVGAGRLWRLTLPQTAAIPDVGEAIAWDWAGAQVWIRSDRIAATIWQAAAEAGGHATLFRGGAGGEEVFQPLEPAMLTLHQRIKRALDPAGILNPGRLYGAL
jgi:glycolate oxidase FAD binding subunit